ncbi:sugar:proton symporter [Candidatus Francisella endociliophora]|uniref:Sugar:proton symporter n=1 Tax=Candidatus Francisella endociliophora TaxID=653937 RepID=A0A097EQP9_9GAMM|nr:MFS transporter [Francisella sp. FSC1006]AIT09899.1 sugar:proton symporter [Francisella sp. FSC1006]
MKLNLDFRYNFKFILFVYILSAIVGGYALAIVGGIGEDIRHHFELNSHQLSILLGLVFLGGILAKIIWLATDRIGRRAMIIFFVAMYIFGTYLFVNSQSYDALIVARFIQGSAILLCTYAFPVYMTEIAPPNKRGRYVALFQLFWTSGMCLSGLAVFFFYKVLSWHEYLYVTVSFALILLFMACIIPASPTWLILRKKVHDAYLVIQKTQPDLSDDEIKKHIDDIRVSLRDHKPRSFLQKVFIGKDIIPVLLVTSVLILNQITGINFIVFSSELILAPLVKNAQVAHIANFFILAINFCATILTIFYIDKWGRKKVIFTGLAVALISMLLLVVLYSLPVFEYSYIAVIVLLISCVAGLAFGPSGVVITLINEILPNRVRIIGIFIAGTASMLFAFFFIGYFLQIGEKYGFNIMFGIIFIGSFIYLMVVKKLVPETAGKTLEEIENEFD